MQRNTSAHVRAPVHLHCLHKCMSNQPLSDVSLYIKLNLLPRRSIIIFFSLSKLTLFIDLLGGSIEKKSNEKNCESHENKMVCDSFRTDFKITQRFSLRSIRIFINELYKFTLPIYYKLQYYHWIIKSWHSNLIMSGLWILVSTRAKPVSKLSTSEHRSFTDKPTHYRYQNRACSLIVKDVTLINIKGKKTTTTYYFLLLMF